MSFNYLNSIFYPEGISAILQGSNVLFRTLLITYML